MASTIDGLSYNEIRELNINGSLNFDELTETEICTLLDEGISQFENEASDKNEALITSCLKGLDRFPRFLTEINDEKIIADVLANQKKISIKPIYRSKNYKLLISVAATIALLLSITAAAYASGYNIFNIIFNRTSETLNIEVMNKNISQLSSSDTDSEQVQLFEKEYDDFETFLSENPNAKLPTYIPDGMEFTYGQSVSIANNQSYNIVFLNKETQEDIALYTETSNEEFAGTLNIEIDNKHSEQYIVSGITHYIESNYQSFSVVWFDENIMYYLGSSLSLKEIKKVIDSYYGG